MNPGNEVSNIGIQTGQEVLPSSNDNKKKGKAGLILVVLIVLALVGVGCWFLLNNKSDKEEKEATKTEEKATKDKKDTKEEKKDEPESVVNTRYSGIYEGNGAKIKIYVSKSGRIIYYYTSDGSIIGGNGKLTNDVAKDSYSDRNFTFRDGSLTIEDNDGDTNISGTYKRTKDYTATEYFEDNSGDIKYFDTKYNAKYSLNEQTMYIYQTAEDKCRVYISGDSGLFDIEFTIKGDGSLYNEFFDDVYTVTFDGDKATFTTVKSDDSDRGKDGTYTKEGKITLDEAIEL